MNTNTPGDARVETQLRDIIAYRGSNLALQTENEGIRWGLFSTTDNLLRYPVTGGWCDNAFDTIRKRGVKASARSSW